ncbi:MAG: protein kinase domain-containing protein [Hylemonella sp.]|uniref:serine/threonine-protein kinase n=1 Tax=Hylemonella sp. TaxID=2066020 RepID=UPI003918EB89
MSRQKLGRYELVKVLGKGAMGLVYEGRDPNLDRRVAIKTIKVENLTDEEAAEYEIRFRTEARSAARLQHPHIVSVYDSDRDGDIAYLVMEFIQGQDLKHHLDRGQRYTLRQAVSIMSDLLAALDYAHQQGVVHRDIKPANLLIEADGRVKLTDFGVARIQDSGEATRTKGTMVGTLKYMSPEQVHGLPIDARSDLFSAGIVLYQLLTGSRPFDGTGDYDIIQKIVGQAPPAPTSLNPQLPVAIDEVITRALAKSREDRYVSAQDFSTALQAAAGLATDPTITPPRSSARSPESSTWTSTMIKGESLVSTSSGTSASITGLPGSTVTQEVELLYWKEIKDSVEIEDFREFLLKFPTGIYADLARRRIKRLQHPDGEPGASRSGTGTRLSMATPSSPDDPTMKIAPAASPVTAPDEEATRMLPPRSAQASEDTSAETATAAGSSHRQRPVWMLGAAAAVVLALGGIYLVSSGSRATAPASTTSPGTSSSAAPRADGAKDTAVSTREAKPVQPAKAKPATTKAESASPPAKTSSPAASPLLVPPPKPAVTPGEPRSANRAATASQDPKQACEGRVLFSYLNCVKEQCAKPGFAQHPVCVEHREMEQRSIQPSL